MARTEYPKWLWDLIIRLEKHEDEHAAPPNGTCFNAVLRLIPSEVRDQAAAISSYAHAAATDAVMQHAAITWTALGLDGKPDDHAGQPVIVLPAPAMTSSCPLCPDTFQMVRDDLAAHARKMHPLVETDG